MAAALAAPIVRGKGVPGGFSDRFARAFTSPTHGGLQDYIGWLAAMPGAEPAWLAERVLLEVRGGWLDQLVQARNRWQHPGGEERSKFLKAAASQGTRMPEALAALHLQASDSRAVLTCSAGVAELAPLAAVEASVV